MRIRHWMALFLALLMIPAMSLAESRLEGQVAPGRVYTLLAPADGRIASVTCAPGDHCEQGDPAALFLETVVRATQDGTVVYVPAHEGESAQTLTDRFGGAMLLIPAEKGTVSGSLRKNLVGVVSSGQDVLLKSASGSTEGRGVLVLSWGEMVTVHVTEGDFAAGEKINVYAGQSLETADQLCTGSFSAAMEFGLSGTGYIAELFVKPGDQVKLGDPLFSTLPYPVQDAPVFSGNGVVLEVFVKAGDQVTAGQPLVSYCLTEELVIDAEAMEYALPYLNEGENYTAMIPALGLEGTAALKAIGACPAVNEAGAAYRASFLPDTMGEALRIGMTAYIVMPEEPEQAVEEP